MRGGREPVVFSKDVSQHLAGAADGAKLRQRSWPSLLELTEEDAEAYRRAGAGLHGSERLLRTCWNCSWAVETEMRWASSPRIALEAAAHEGVPEDRRRRTAPP